MELPDLLGVMDATATDTQNVTRSSETLAGFQYLRPVATRPHRPPIFCLALCVPRPLFLHPQPIIYLIISLLSGLWRESNFLCYKYRCLLLPPSIPMV